jgi:hypothetical protein
MGAGATVDMPDMMDRATVEAMTGNRFDAEVFAESKSFDE